MNLRECYLIPTIEKCVASLEKAKIICTLGASSGYWQMEIDAEDKDRSSLVTHDQLYIYPNAVRVENAPGTFQGAASVVSAAVKWQYVFVCIENITLFSTSPEDHERHIDTVMKVIEDSGMTLKLKKYHFY